MELTANAHGVRGSISSLTELPEYISKYGIAVSRLTITKSRRGHSAMGRIIRPHGWDMPSFFPTRITSVSTFFPASKPLLTRYPKLFRFLGVILAFYYFGPVARVQQVWNQCSSLLVSSVQVTSDEDLFTYLSNFLAEKRAIRPNQSLNAITNPLQESRRSRHDPEYEETAQRNFKKDAGVKYEQGQGMQIFVHKRRLFWVQRKDGEGHSYHGNRYKRQEILQFSCLGRSVAPIKEMMEEIYKINKDKEKSLTVIRRPYGSGYGSRLTWSRLTAKRRRQLDTVILQESQTATIIADVEEYMSETTRAFYADHGIPYRRGYLFHGPPGCGKTSFCLALASKFDLDVYILTLLDKEITDTDLMSLLNQLPTPSLLLLEDIDEAGLNRKSKAFASQRNRKNKKDMPEGAIDSTDDAYESEEEDSRPKTHVTLSGLLNAIDGVAAPEGHILIMTTNKPHELDDALVRAGRISVHVQFSNATRKQAEQIFLRMFTDTPSITSTTPTSTSSPTSTPTTINSEEKQPNLQSLAQEFSSHLTDNDFSPADLQDYLLIHKKHPARAVASFPKWITEKHDERRRKEEEKEEEFKWKMNKAEERRRKWREDLKRAVSEGGTEKGLELIKTKEKEEKEKERKKEEGSDSDDSD